MDEHPSADVLGEIRRLKAVEAIAMTMLDALEANVVVAELQKPFIAGINRGSSASDEVKQEASDRLGAAQKNWWKLRAIALEAAAPLRRARPEGQGDG